MFSQPAQHCLEERRDSDAWDVGNWPMRVLEEEEEVLDVLRVIQDLADRLRLRKPGRLRRSANRSCSHHSKTLEPCREN